jgi:hypothetical protein
MIAVGAITVASFATVNAQPYYSVYAYAQASPDDAGWSVPSVSPITLSADETNGATSFDLDTQVHHAMVYVRSLGRTVPTEARARAAASLATGEVKLFVGADGVDYFLTASASANAYFVDYVTFDLPDGITERLGTLKFRVAGEHALNDIVWHTQDALASLGFGASYDTKYIYRGWDGLVNTLPFELSVSAMVTEGAPYQVLAALSASIGVKDIYSYIDVEQTGTLSVEVPEGVAYTSFSQVLLTETEPAIAEPATFVLLILGGLLCLARRSRN